MMDKQFAENLKNARIRAGLTQAQVAEKIGVAPSSYSFYESGKREPDVLKIRQLADVLGVTGNELLGIEEDDLMVVARLTHMEDKMMDMFRTLPADQQKLVYDLVNILYGNGIRV